MVRGLQQSLPGGPRPDVTASIQRLGLLAPDHASSIPELASYLGTDELSSWPTLSDRNRPFLASLDAGDGFNRIDQPHRLPVQSHY